MIDLIIGLACFAMLLGIAWAISRLREIRREMDEMDAMDERIARKYRI